MVLRWRPSSCDKPHQRTLCSRVPSSDNNYPVFSYSALLGLFTSIYLFLNRWKPILGPLIARLYRRHLFAGPYGREILCGISLWNRENGRLLLTFSLFKRYQRHHSGLELIGSVCSHAYIYHIQHHNICEETVGCEEGRCGIPDAVKIYI